MKIGNIGKDFVERRKTNNYLPTSSIPHLTFNQSHARVLMMLMLLFSDAVSLLLAYMIAIWLRMWIVGDLSFLQVINLVPIMAFSLIMYAWHGLYPGIGLSPVREMKQLFSATNIVFLIMITMTFWMKTSTDYSRFLLGTTWLLVLILVQASRWLVRIVGRKLGIWGNRLQW
jgi:FlaA1/EpsC-like NDP-sugar epimerase